VILPDCYEHNTPNARKPHNCCECRATIYEGDDYHRFRGKWEGRWETYKVCKPCWSLRERLASELYDPLGFGMVRDHLIDCCAADVADDPDILRFWARWMRSRSEDDRAHGWTARSAKDMDEDDVRGLIQIAKYMSRDMERASRLLECVAGEVVGGAS